MNKPLHIVCLDAPSPPDYGGAIDMYYKIAALAASGRKIILHYFDYNPKRNATGLEDHCIEVNAYKRKGRFRAFPLATPFIVGSRINKELINRLNQDDHPVLLEGIHTTGILPYLDKNRTVVVRMHNNEAAYYQSLARSEKGWKKLYFLREAELLHLYQSALSTELVYACVSESDTTTLENIYGWGKNYFIPCFLPWQEVKPQDGKGDFALYHGNLGVKENEVAALWLIKEIFSNIQIPFIIAGNALPQSIRTAAIPFPHIKLIEDPSIEALNKLVSEAQVHVLPSVNNTGVKLKLLHALMEGRFCITNEEGVKGSGLADCVELVSTPSEWKHAIKQSMNTEFNDGLLIKRKKALGLYDNMVNAAKLNELL